MSEPFDPIKATPILAEAVTSVFADMAFIDAQVLAPGRPRRAAVDNEVRAAIDALKPTSSCLELRMTSALKARIASILYVDNSNPAAGGEDALLEILNVIAGKFLTDYFGSGFDIKLELPRYLYLGQESEGQAVTVLDFDAEGETLEAVLSAVRYRY